MRKAAKVERQCSTVLTEKASPPRVVAIVVAVTLELAMQKTFGAGFFGVTGVSGRKVAVGKVFLEDGVGDLAMKRQALGLFVFFIPAQIEPSQA